MSSRFKRSGETISRYFNSILDRKCLGALDGTYIRVHVPEQDKPRYRTRKGEVATNVLGVCTPDMKFIFVFPGWEGSASDSRVLRDAISRPTRLRVLVGCYYLVDGGYTNGQGYLAPYRGTRYHLSEWRNRRAPNNHEEYFNMKHDAARNVIERCFGLLKMRWGILRSPTFFPIETQCKIITACCLLYNLICGEMMAIDSLENELNGSENRETNQDGDVLGTIEPSDQ
ncbi:unnamed protein product [Prunus armeniaca]